MIRENLELVSTDPPLKTILVTSFDKGVGKSSISTNLSIIMAQKDRDVILLDADLRNSSVHDLLSLQCGPGLSDILEDGRGISATLQSYKSIKGGVLTAGTPPENPAELLGSPKMDWVLDALKKASDVVIIDAPPLYVSESLALSHKVDGVLLVVQLGSTSRKLIKRTMEQINWAGARVIGVVLNRMPGAGDAYYGADLYSSYVNKDTRSRWPWKKTGRLMNKPGADKSGGSKGQGTTSTSFKDIGERA
jgi:capsular exopolysaccharide synthesis family protein